MRLVKDNYTLITDKSKIDVSYIHRVLSNTYWAKNIPFETVQISIHNSLCFSIFYNDSQVGFARVITDTATFAYLCDVFIDDEHKGKGLGKWLVESILKHEQLQGLRRFILATKDAHGLYKQFGFEQLSNVDRWMHIHDPDVYNR